MGAGRSADTGSPALGVPSMVYHQELSACLRKHEDGLWDWFASDELTEHANRDARLYLLKNAIRLDEADHGNIHALAREVAGALGITLPVILYQGSNGGQRNAMLVTMTSEVAIFFGGDILSFLNEAETRALLAHEMAHYVFKSLEDSRFNIADNLLSWICRNGGEPSHRRSLWLSQLYQEIYADRVAVEICGGIEAPLSLLVKIGAGIANVSPRAYLTQAEEALDLATRDGQHKGAADGSHPELFIRALAIRDWQEDRDWATDKLKLMVEGEVDLDSLDLVQQAKTTDMTRAVIEVLIKPHFTNSERLEVQAREYFPDFDRRTALTVDATELASRIRSSAPGIKSYLCYVLADFAMADAELDDFVLMEAIRLVDEWDMRDAFDAMAAKDLAIDGKRLAGLRERIEKLLGTRADNETGEACR